MDRLTGATGGYGTVSYTYNQIGNMLSNSKVGTYRYNASGATSTRPHAVTQTGTGADTTTYSDDANGNVIVGGGRIITWDEENRPQRMIKDGVTTRFVYDGDGGRVKKTVSRTSVDDLTDTAHTQATTTVYIGKLLVCEGTVCAKQIYAGSQRVALVQGSGSTSYFHPDHLGSTSVLTDGNGTAEEHNSYLPYGDIHTHTGTTDVAYKYTGQERDASTGVYFYHARYYGPVLGRFLSPDTLVPNPWNPQSLNRYAYALNNPLRYTDPTGHWPDWWDDGWDEWVEQVNAYLSSHPSDGSVPVLPELVVPGQSLYSDFLSWVSWLEEQYGLVPAFELPPMVVPDPFVPPEALVGQPTSPNEPPPATSPPSSTPERPATSRTPPQLPLTVSGAGSSVTFVAGPTIIIRPSSDTFGLDSFTYLVDYRWIDPRDPTGSTFLPDIRGPFWPKRVSVTTGFSRGFPDRPFTAGGVYGRVRWWIKIPLQPVGHGNSAGWNLQVDEIQ